MSGSIHRELGKYRHAEQDLLTAVRILQQCEAVQQEANAQLALASLYLRRRKPEKSHAHLKRGVTIGRDRGLTYYALHTPEELGTLARYAAAQGILPDYCSSLIERTGAVTAQPILSIFCLGGFRVRKKEVPIRERDWKGKRTKQFVKLLASRTGKPLSRDAVIDVIRPDSDPAQHTGAVANLLHRVRKTLDSARSPGTTCSAIHYENEHLSFDRSLVWTDVEAFRAAIGEAHRADNRKDPAAALRHYEEALSLYQGDFLPEDVFEDWTVPIRDDLRATYVKALERGAEIAIDFGDLQRAAAIHGTTLPKCECRYSPADVS